MIPILALSGWSYLTYGFGPEPIWIAYSGFNLLLIVAMIALAFSAAFLRRERVQVVVLWFGFAAGIMALALPVLSDFAIYQTYKEILNYQFDVGSELKGSLGFYIYHASNRLSAEANFVEGLFPMARIGLDLATIGLFVAALVSTVSRNSAVVAAATPSPRGPLAMPQGWPPQAADTTASAVRFTGGAVLPSARHEPSTGPQPQATSAFVSNLPPAQVITPEIRRGFLVEAIRREPSFATAQDTATLRRLGEMMRDMEQEYRLKMELTQLQDAQIAAVDRAAVPPLDAPSEAAPASMSSTSLAGETVDWDGIRS